MLQGPQFAFRRLAMKSGGDIDIEDTRSLWSLTCRSQRVANEMGKIIDVYFMLAHFEVDITSAGDEGAIGEDGYFFDRRSEVDHTFFSNIGYFIYHNIY